MSAGTVFEAVCTQLGLIRPKEDFGAADIEARQVREHMNKAGRDLVARAEWSRLTATQEITGTGVALPADFHRLAETGVVIVNGKPARGVLSPENWTLLTGQPSAQAYFHLSGGNLLLSLPATTGSMRYVSKNWVVGGKSVLSVIDDTMHVPDSLVESGAVWRWRRQKGLPYDDDLAEFEALLLTEISADRGGM